MITIDGKEYDETKFSPDFQVNATRHKLELEKIDVLTKHYNAKIVELLKKETESEKK